MDKRLLLLGFVLSGCASTSAVHEVGPGVYHVSSHYAPIRGGSSAAQDDVMRTAKDYCDKQGKQIMMTASQRNVSSLTDKTTGYEATFECVDKK